MKIFKKPPTTAQVITKIENLEITRARLVAESQQVQNQLIEAYGTDADSSALMERSFKIDMELKVISAQLEFLENALVDAKTRAIVAEYESLCRQASAMIKELNTNKATLQALHIQYQTMMEEDRRKRREIQAQTRRISDYVLTVDPDHKNAVMPEISNIRAKFTDLDTTIANSFVDAINAPKNIQIARAK